MPLPHFSALSPRVSRSSVSAAFSCAAQRLSASGTPRTTPLSASTSRALLAPPAAHPRVDSATTVLPPSFPLDRCGYSFRKSRAITGNSAKLASGILIPTCNASAFSASARAVSARAQMASAAVGDAGSVPEIKGRVEANGVAVLTMDRPKALNAMNLGMDRAYKALLDEWAVDPRVKAVVVEGSTPRAFSAGMDIKGAVGYIKEDINTPYVPQVFTAEYTLICAIARYPKPYIALMDGVTMGFGLGLSAHGRYRVVTERALMAMPENAIGLFPDVGFARIAALSPAGGALGTYMGMTGARISTPHDALLAGLATHYVPSTALPTLKEALLQADFASASAPADASSLVETILSRHTQPTTAAAGGEGAGVAGSQIEAVLAAIERCFHRSQCPSVPHVLAALRAEEKSADSTVSQWAKDSLQAMAAGAPFSLAITLKHFHALSARAADAAATAPNQAEAEKLLPIEDVMRTEYRMALRTSVRPDFLEGVRAVLIDKDKFSQVGHGSGGRDGGVNIRGPPETLPYNVRGLNHIAIAVPDLSAASEFYRTTFGAQVSEPHDLPEHGVRVVIAQVSNCTVELLHPLGEKSPIAKFLEKNPRGGMHHLCFTVDDIGAASKHVSTEGIRVLGDGKPKIGAHGNPVLFLDPRDNLGVLCEFEQVSCAEPHKA
ncbi:unnamed protein product [Closterium sp. Naga37s-1]|nr:unnamed protein product [Closterium sp. Naga37s-1]